tara:strand:+ start:2525 stop:3580 length:1056 start_codon:yes stop_codon:yes gene_type:complete
LGDGVFDIIKKVKWGRESRQSMAAGAVNSCETSSTIADAFQYGIYGIAVWDKNFDLIAANRQYADLHKIPSTLLTPGSNLLSIMHNLKVRGVLSPETDPDALMKFIKTTLSDTGQLTSRIRFSDDTVLEISAERMSDGNTAAYLRNATRDNMFTKRVFARKQKADAYVEAIAKFPLPANTKTQKDLTSEINHITQTVATLLEVDWCIVWVKSNILNEAAAASAYQSATQAHIEIESMVLPDLTEYLAILETSRVIAIDDLDKHAFGKVQGNRAPLDDYAHASLDSPFRQEGKIIGVLSCLDTKKARTWTAGDKMLVMAAASHIGNLISAPEQNNLWALPTGEINSGRQAAE